VGVRARVKGRLGRNPVTAPTGGRGAGRRRPGHRRPGRMAQTASGPHWREPRHRRPASGTRREAGPRPGAPRPGRSHGKDVLQYPRHLRRVRGRPHPPWATCLESARPPARTSDCSWRKPGGCIRTSAPSHPRFSTRISSRCVPAWVGRRSNPRALSGVPVCGSSPCPMLATGARPRRRLRRWLPWSMD